MGELLANAGVRWVRLDIHIPEDLSIDVNAEIKKNDYFINEVAPRHGFEILALLSFDLLKGWNPRALNCEQPAETYQNIKCEYPKSIYGGGVNAYMDAWLTRALAVADRYGSKIAAYEILNEQNRLPSFGPGTPGGDAITPEMMARLMTKFYRFCHGLGPVDGFHGCGSADIILGGLHPYGTTNDKNQMLMTDVEYLEEVYKDPSFATFEKAYGKQKYPLDGIGYHPYPEEIRPRISDDRINSRLPELRSMLVDPAIGDPCRQLWITEIGYNVGFDPDGSKNPRPAQTELGQAAFLEDVYRSLARRTLSSATCGGAPEIANVFWFKYEDFPGAPAQNWGLVHIPYRDGDCAGGCYAYDGVPSRYRFSYWVYRELAGVPPTQLYQNRIYMPIAGR
jgi:hypothetical protein